MADLSSKKPSRAPATGVRRGVRRVGSSPIPKGPTGGEMASACGHMNCTGPSCQVRYCGPTSHIRDHHIMHAAHGASQVWTAAIVAGLAIVITGVFAFSRVDAKEQNIVATTAVASQDVSQRLDRIDAALAKLMTQCGDAQVQQQVPLRTQLDQAMGGAAASATHH